MENVVAQKIKSILDDNQISITAFSKMIGMQQVTCNRQIRGDQAVSLGLIEGFLKVFGDVSAEWLLRGEGEQNRSCGSSISQKPTNNKQVGNDLNADSPWHSRYLELEKRYDQLLSLLGGGFQKANVG